MPDDCALLNRGITRLLKARKRADELKDPRLTKWFDKGMADIQDLFDVMCP